MREGKREREEKRREKEREEGRIMGEEGVGKRGEKRASAHGAFSGQGKSIAQIPLRRYSLAPLPWSSALHQSDRMIKVHSKRGVSFFFKNKVRP